MRIEQGFGKFNKGEKIEVDLLQIKYTKNNHRPYAVVDAGEGKFNVNIKDIDANCTPGKYIIECTGVNDQGFCYINLCEEPQQNLYPGTPAPQTTTTPNNENNTIDDLAYNISITHHYRKNLKTVNAKLTGEDADKIYDSINTILKILYQQYGIAKYKEEEKI